MYRELLEIRTGEWIIMRRKIFGNENAERDKLLETCKVSRGVTMESMPILIGRWGTGKTAILLMRHRKLEEVLKSIDPELSRIWYISEHSLDMHALVKLNTETEDQILFTRALQNLWKGEVYRRYCNLLQALRNTYKNNQGSHWKFIEKIGNKGYLQTTIWKNVPLALKLVSPDLTESIDDASKELGKIFTEQCAINVRRCLRDIEQDELRPSIAIEPIETPHSELEHKAKLGESIVTALMNVLRSDFEPYEDCDIDVSISIPWHRYKGNKLDFPQKLIQYRGFVFWKKNLLREFINKRIEFEFQRVNRKFQPRRGRDAWVELFGKSIETKWQGRKIREDSFDYFLRHTHHRPRDLQRLARVSVLYQADTLGIEPDDVLAGRKSTSTPYVTQNSIRDAIKSEGQSSTEELITEASRRYPAISKLVPKMVGMTVPFNEAYLKKRLTDEPVVLNGEEIDYNTAFTQLWHSGIIGVSVSGITINQKKRLVANMDENIFITYKLPDGKSLMCGHWFEYLWHGDDPSDILNQLRTHGLQDQAKLVIHPRTFEYLAPREIDSPHPIGT